MKIKALLQEDSTDLDFDSDSAARPSLSPLQVAYKAFDALSPLQIGILRKLAGGSFDPFSASDKTLEVMDQLVDLGLLDSGYELTDTGSHTVRIASKVKSSGLRDAQQKAVARREMSGKAAPRPQDIEVEIEDEFADDPANKFGVRDLDAEEAPEEEVDLGGVLRTEKRKAKKPAVVKPMGREDFESFDKDEDDYIDDEGEYKWD